MSNLNGQIALLKSSRLVLRGVRSTPMRYFALGMCPSCRAGHIPVSVYLRAEPVQVRIRCAGADDILRQIVPEYCNRLQGRMFAKVVQADSLAAP